MSEIGVTTQTSMVIGEIEVRIQTHISCGLRWWYGRFPDRSFCCEHHPHTTRDEAVLCARLRVAEGFYCGPPATEEPT